MVRVSLLGTAALLGLLFASCTMPVPSREVILGNYSYSRGEYQDATVHYLEAMKQEKGVQPWVAYNLGNVYHSLGEVNAAMQMWDQAARSDDPELLYRVNFNRGIAFYESGKFDDAYRSFRQALELNSSSVDAKINLELSQKKLQAAAQGGDSVKALEKENPGEDDTRILEYVRRKEGRQWVSAPQETSSPNTADW